MFRGNELPSGQSSSEVHVLSRNRRKSAALEQLELENDRSYIRAHLSGTLRAAFSFSNSTLERAKLIKSWHWSAAESTDVGGKRGLAQQSVVAVLDAVRRVIECAEPLDSDIAKFEELSHRFVASNPPRPLSILGAGAVLAAWTEPRITALFGGSDCIHLGWPHRGASPPNERPWLQILPSFYMGGVDGIEKAAIQFETVAESWRESAALAKAVVNRLPLKLRTFDKSLIVADFNTTGITVPIVRATFDDWELCRCIAQVVVQAEV